MNDPAQQPHQHSRTWSEFAQALAAVVWPSFLAACLATMLFFAFVDPADLGEIFPAAMDWSRMTGYAAGFFFFWGICLTASALTAYLLHTSRTPDS